METPAVQERAILTLINPRTDRVECLTVANAEPATWVPYLLEFCGRHCLAPSDVSVSLSTVH